MSAADKEKLERMEQYRKETENRRNSWQKDYEELHGFSLDEYVAYKQNYERLAEKKKLNS